MGRWEGGQAVTLRPPAAGLRDQPSNENVATSATTRSRSAPKPVQKDAKARAAHRRLVTAQLRVLN